MDYFTGQEFFNALIVLYNKEGSRYPLMSRYKADELEKIHNLSKNKSFDGPPPEVWKFESGKADKYLRVENNQKLIGEIISNIIRKMISLIYGFETGGTSWSKAKPEAIQIFQLHAKLDPEKLKLFNDLMSQFNGKEFFNVLKTLKDKA
jgi:hypothetical protein